MDDRPTPHRFTPDSHFDCAICGEGPSSSNHLPSTPLTDAMLKRTGMFVGEKDENTQFGKLKSEIRRLERDRARLKEALEHIAALSIQTHIEEEARAALASLEKK